MSDKHLQNAYASLKRRTYKDGNPRVLSDNMDVLEVLAVEMRKRGIAIPQVEWKTGWIFTQITEDGDDIYDLEYMDGDVDGYF